MAEDKKEFQRRVKAFDEAFEAEDWDKAIELGEAIRTEFPDSFYAGELDAEYLAGAYNNRGATYAKLGQYARAIADYDRVIELKPELAVAYIGRGGSYAGLGQHERAIKDYDRAIEIDPENVDAHNNRALAIGRQEAEKATKAIKESYDERLSSITTPAEIDKRFEARKKLVKND